MGVKEKTINKTVTEILNLLWILILFIFHMSNLKTAHLPHRAILNGVQVKLSWLYS